MVLNTPTFSLLFLQCIRHLDLLFRGHTTHRCWAFFEWMSLSIYLTYLLVSASPFLDYFQYRRFKSTRSFTYRVVLASFGIILRP